MRAPLLWLAGVVSIGAGLSARGSAVPSPAPTPTPTPTPAIVFSPIVPPDVPEPPNGYTGLDPLNQTHFDEFSWKSFAAVNWPVTPSGNILPQGFPFKNNQAPRQWESWTDPEDLFRGGLQPICPAGRKLEPGTKVLHLMAKNSQILNPDGSFVEPDGNPLIDMNLNYALYEIRINPDETSYITGNNLQTKAGQAGKTIAFPTKPTGAIEVKAVWRILTKKDDPSRYYTRTAVVYVPPQNTQDGVPLCLDVTVGLAGLHVIHKTGNFPQWIWSTFEHVDNAPTSPPSSADKASYSFYSNAFRFYLPINTPHPPSTRKDNSRVYYWMPDEPYARLYAWQANDYTKLQFGTQVVRSNSIYPTTSMLNMMWQKAMAGSFWANYMLIGSQWVGGDAPGHTIAAPMQLANAAIETYIQDTASCVQCHAGARSAVGTPADFSFLLGLAQ